MRAKNNGIAATFGIMHVLSMCESVVRDMPCAFYIYSN